jgi:hypothetical protein
MATLVLKKRKYLWLFATTNNNELSARISHEILAAKIKKI